MLLALSLWLLGQFGVAPEPEALQRYELAFQERQHHLSVDVANLWMEDRTLLAFGLGYEFLVDRAYHGVSFELLGQRLGTLGGESDWWVGGGLGYYPIRHLKLFAQAGALILDESDPGPRIQASGRLGGGYRLTFFTVVAMPYLFVESSTGGLFTWGLGGRVQY